MAWPRRRSDRCRRGWSSRRSADRHAAGLDGLEAERLMPEHRLPNQVRSPLGLAGLFEEARIRRRGGTPVLASPLAGPRRLAEEDDRLLHGTERAPERLLHLLGDRGEEAVE